MKRGYAHMTQKDYRLKYLVESKLLTDEEFTKLSNMMKGDQEMRNLAEELIIAKILEHFNKKHGR